MQMRLLLSTATFFFLQFYANAQNIDRDAVAFNYVLMPLQKLPDSAETYFVNVKNRNTIWGNSLGNTLDADAIQFNGYYKLPSAFDADIVTEVELVHDIQFVQVTMRSATYKQRIDKNTEIPYTAYTFDIKYISPKTYFKLSAANGTTIEENTYGGLQETSFFGSTDYESSYKSEYALSRAWEGSKKYTMAELEQTSFKNAMSFITEECNSYCLMPTRASFSVKYVKEKKTNDYDDLRQAKNLLEEAAEYYKTDEVKMTNKLIQPDYDKRNRLLDSAITIWTKALEESDLKNKKARIDQKVTRHIYYNIAFAYALKNDFDHAQQFLQGREDEETNTVVLKNAFAGMKNLSSFIDQQSKRKNINKWRSLLYEDPSVYVYKDPATRKKEKEEALQKQMAMQKAKSDSLKAQKKGSHPVKPVTKKVTNTNAGKSASSATTGKPKP